MTRVPHRAGSKLVRDFVGHLLVANKKLKWADAPMVPKRATTNFPALKPDVVYTAGKGSRNAAGKKIKYAYTTDAHGRIATAHARPLELPAQNTRAGHNKNPPGKTGADHAGHLFADMFGGSSKLDNIVAQLDQVNLKKMAALERQWKKRLQAGEKNDIDIKVQYDPTSMRPIGFEVYELIDGESLPVGEFIN